MPAMIGGGRGLNFQVTLDGIDRVMAQLKALGGQMERTAKTHRATLFVSIQTAATTKLKELQVFLKALKTSFVADLDTSKFTAKIKKIGSTIAGAFKGDANKKWYEKTFGFFSKLEKKVENVGAVIAGVFGAAGAAMVVAGGIAGAILVKQLIKINSQMEQFEVSLQTTIGSLTEAKKEMAGIVQFAKETPYAIAEVTDAVVKLRAYAMDPDKWLRPLGDMASAFGRPITDAVEAAADAAQGMFRRALSYGIRMERNDFKQGGKYAGMDYGEAFLMEVEKRFKGGMLLQAQTLKGIWSNIKDAMTITFQKATQPVYKMIKGIVNDFYNKLNNAEYAQKLQERFQKITAIIFKVTDALGAAINYIQTNFVPAVSSFGEAALKSFTSIVAIIGAFTSALGGPTAVVLANTLHLISELVTRLQILIKIIVGLKIARMIFALVSRGAAEAAAKMVEAGQAATFLEARLRYIGARAVKLGVTIAGIMLLDKFLEIRNGLKEVESAFTDVAKPFGSVRDYLQQIGEENGQTLDNMVKAANAAKEFGANAQNSLEIGTKYAKSFNLSAEESVQVVGKLAKAYIGGSTAADQFNAKTQEIADMLDTFKGASVGSFDDLVSSLEEFPEVLEKSATGLEGLTQAILAYSVATKGASISNFLNIVSQAMQPSREMFEQFDPGVWISRNTEELRNLSAASNDQKEAFEANADVIEEIMADYGKLGSELNGTAYNLSDVSSLIRELSAKEVEAADAVQYWKDKVQDIEEELQQLQRMLGAVNLELTQVNGVMEQTSNVLNLAYAVQQMRVYGETVANTGKTIAQMNAHIADEEVGLKGLQAHLDRVSNQFQRVSDRIQDAQERLDKFTHPKLEGMGEFDDKIHNIDMQLNQLNRQKLDVQARLRVFEEAGLTGTDAYRMAAAPLQAIEDQIAVLQNSRDKLELDRKIAYDDQLYQLEKIADTQEEITFSEAVTGAKKAKKEIERLTPQMEALGKQKDNLAEQVKLAQDHIDKEKDLVEQKQAEIDAQADLIKSELERLELQKQIYDYEASITDQKLIGAKLNALQGNVSPGDLKVIEDMYGAAAQRAGILNERKTNLENQIAQTQFNQDYNTAQQADAEGNLSKIGGDIKALVQASQNLVTGLNFEKLVNTQQSALENVFGKDNAGVLKSMEGLLGTIASNSSGGGGNGGLGILGKLQNFATSGTGLAIIGSLFGTKMLSKPILKAFGKESTLTGYVAKKIGNKVSTSWAERKTAAASYKNLGPQAQAFREGKMAELDKISAAEVKSKEKLAKSVADEVSIRDDIKKNEQQIRRDRYKQVSTAKKTTKAAQANLDATNKAWKEQITRQKAKINIFEEGLRDPKTGELRGTPKQRLQRAEMYRQLHVMEQEPANVTKAKKALQEAVAKQNLPYEGSATQRKAAESRAKLKGRLATQQNLTSTLSKEVDDLGKAKTFTQNAIDKTREVEQAIKRGRMPKALTGYANFIKRSGIEGIEGVTQVARRGLLKAGSRAEKGIMGGLFSIPLFGNPAKKMGKAVGGGGSSVSRIKNFLAGALSGVSSGEAIAKNKVPQRILEEQVRRFSARDITGNVLRRFRSQRGAASINALTFGLAGPMEKLGSKLPKLGGFGRLASLVSGGGQALGRLGTTIGENLAKFSGKSFVKVLGKGLLGAGPLGLATMGVDIGNFIKGDFMNEKVWKKAFGGKTIQEFAKDNPISRYMYSAFGKDNVSKMFKPVENVWNAATHASDMVGNAFGSLFGLGKGIFTGNFDTLKENIKGFGKNAVGVLKDIGKTTVSVVKAIPAIGSAIKTSWNKFWEDGDLFFKTADENLAEFKNKYDYFTKDMEDLVGFNINDVANISFGLEKATNVGRYNMNDAYAELAKTLGVIGYQAKSNYERSQQAIDSILNGTNVISDDEEKINKLAEYKVYLYQRQLDQLKNHNSLLYYQAQMFVTEKQRIKDLYDTGKMGAMEYKERVEGLGESIRTNAGITNQWKLEQLDKWADMGMEDGSAYGKEVRAAVEKYTQDIYVKVYWEEVKKASDRYYANNYAFNKSGIGVGALQSNINSIVEELTSVFQDPKYGSVLNEVMSYLPGKLDVDSKMGPKTVDAARKLMTFLPTIMGYMKQGGDLTEEQENAYLGFKDTLAGVSDAYMRTKNAAEQAQKAQEAAAKSAEIQGKASSTHAQIVHDKLDKLDKQAASTSGSVKKTMGALSSSVSTSLDAGVKAVEGISTTPVYNWAKKFYMAIASALGYGIVGGAASAGVGTSGIGAAASGRVTGAEGDSGSCLPNLANLTGGPGQMAINVISDILGKTTNLQNYSNLPVASPTSKTRTGMIDFAKQFLGKVPYVWGGTTTKGWDCSGFVGYVLSNFGIKHPRTAAAMYGAFPKVSRDHLLPGDLVFYWNGKDRYPASHVAMAIDKNREIEAVPGKNTIIRNIGASSSRLMGYGRIPLYHAGGINNDPIWKEKLALIRGQEAVVPLASGNIPVTLLGNKQSSGNVEVNYTVEINATVRNDEDIKKIVETLEEHEKVLVKVIKNQSSIKSGSVFNY